MSERVSSPKMRPSGSVGSFWGKHKLFRSDWRGQRKVSLGTMYIRTARDVDLTPLWMKWTVIRASLLVSSVFWEPKTLHNLGTVNRTKDTLAAPVATIWSKASQWMND